MGALDFFENLRDGGSEKGGKEAAEPVGAVEPAAPSAPPAPAASDHADLEAPLLQQNGANDDDPHHAIPEQLQVPPILLQAPPPDNDPLLYVCRVLSAVTAVGALLCLLVNAISLFRSFDYRGFDYRVSVCPQASVSTPFSSFGHYYYFEITDYSESRVGWFIIWRLENAKS
jgi:hypothetical protein